jgi:hypothetical protein
MDLSKRHKQASPGRTPAGSQARAKPVSLRLRWSVWRYIPQRWSCTRDFWDKLPKIGGGRTVTAPGEHRREQQRKEKEVTGHAPSGLRLIWPWCQRRRSSPQLSPHLSKQGRSCYTGTAWRTGSQPRNTARRQAFGVLLWRIMICR